LSCEGDEMTEMEMGKQRAEQFIVEIAKKLSLDAGQFELLWWSPEQQEGTDIQLRIYKGRAGNSWRQKQFPRSDIENCVKSPDVLAKHEEEITEILTDL
jgi:hypothetical protein